METDNSKAMRGLIIYIAINYMTATLQELGKLAKMEPRLV